MRIADAQPRRATNVSISGELLDEARALEINLSATLERALEAEVRVRRRKLWLEENQEAMAAYNARVERDGVFSDGLRSF